MVCFCRGVQRDNSAAASLAFYGCTQVYTCCIDPGFIAFTLWCRDERSRFCEEFGTNFLGTGQLFGVKDPVGNAAL